MQNALSHMKNVVGRGRGATQRVVVCLETGEQAFMTDWAGAIAEQRGIKKSAVLSSLSRSVLKGHTYLGLHFAYLDTLEQQQQRPRTVPQLRQVPSQQQQQQQQPVVMHTFVQPPATAPVQALAKGYTKKPKQRK